MTMNRRPRVAAIGLDSAQVASIEPLCGELRVAHSLGDYLGRYSWTETDVMVSSYLDAVDVDSGINFIVIKLTYVRWMDLEGGDAGYYCLAIANTDNTERELSVHSACPNLYKPLAAELSRQLNQAAEPTTTISTTLEDQTVLIETTSGRPVALRVILPTRSSTTDGETSRPVALLLPEASNLVAWFRTFLCDIHKSDPTRVPQQPPRLSQPSDWYTPPEKVLADRIAQNESESERLNNERDQLQAKLADEGERSDRGIRRALWADGDDLTAAIRELFANLGFAVRDMDAGLSQGEPKCEDLRLTLQDVPGWEAIVEVKGYTNGTRTTDSRQIREHRDRYIGEVGRPPNLTAWLCNPYRRSDPSSRPAPDQNVKVTAETIGAVHVLASDLYRQWALVGAGNREAETVIQSLMNAEPGLWTPPAPGSST